MNKPGWQTTEFWVSIASSLCGLAVTLGYLTTDQSTPIVKAIEQISGGVIMLGSVFGYAISRGLTKMGKCDTR
jgi:zinc transporter ZupT